MMGLRTRWGLSIKTLENSYDYVLNAAQKEYLNRQQQRNMVTFNETIKLTDSGILLADAITLDFISLHE
jgi:coproporphyrinogen III oxidase-like Fe-S oxidoreductase